jgi:phosphate starvation-inducible PhoH-like protein
MKRLFLLLTTSISTSSLKIKIPPLFIPPTPKSPTQQKYVDCLNNEQIKILLGIGPAGTGKTMFACNYAIQELKAKHTNKIILTRPIVSTDEELGFLPGNIHSKMEPWTRPIFDIFLETYTKQELHELIKSNIIEISPLAFMRGRTFKHAIIIADEMQNSSPNQMFMLTTRLGHQSKLIITGDLNQSDRSTNNGLFDLMNKINLSKHSMIDIVQFQQEDIERSEIVKTIMNIYHPSLPSPLPSSSSPLSSSSSSSPLPPLTQRKIQTTNMDCAMIPIEEMKKNHLFEKNHPFNPFL